MLRSEGSQEQVARQLAGVRHLLESIAEEADSHVQTQIAQASRILSRIAVRCPGQPFPVDQSCLAPAPTQTLTQLVFDTSETVTRRYSLSPFNNVEVDCAFIFEIVAGDSHTVTIKASESLFEYVNVVKSGDTLKLALKPLRFNYRPVLEAIVTMPLLLQLRQGAATKGMLLGFHHRHPLDLYLSGASSLNLDVEVGDARVEISGASRVTGALTAHKVDLMLSGASRMCLDGSCDSLLLSGWGAADLDLRNFRAQDGTVYLKGASHAAVSVAGKLNVDLTGASWLQYSGNPDLNETNVTGASVLNRTSSPE
jgi:hypothetical protein